jgi:hypothetical protein
MVLLQKPETYCLHPVLFDENLKIILNEYLARSVTVKQNAINA